MLLYPSEVITHRSYNCFIDHFGSYPSCASEAIGRTLGRQLVRLPRPVLYRLRQVRSLDALRAGQVSYRPRQLQRTMVNHSLRIYRSGERVTCS